MAEDEMVGWHRLDGHEFDKTLRNGEGQESLACCSPWGRKESYTTEPLKNNSKQMSLSKEGQKNLCWPFFKKKYVFIWPFQVVVVTCKLFVKACEI